MGALHRFQGVCRLGKRLARSTATMTGEYLLGLIDALRGAVSALFKPEVRCVDQEYRFEYW